MGENVLKFGTYVRVGNAAEAYELLQKNRNNKIVGGGIWMRLGSRRVATAIDLSACGLDQIEETHDLSTMKVGLLGMAFKGESDDIRSSLSYKLKRLLNLKADRVLCTDPYVTVDEDLEPLDVVLEQADLLVIAAPHRAYRSLAPRVPAFDIWNVLPSAAAG